MKFESLRAEALCQRCEPEQFDFKTTEDLESLGDIIGQERAVEAIRFGIGIQQEGYNLFATGPAGTSKRHILQRFFEEAAHEQPVPEDWCYVHNFKQAHKPLAIRFPPGQGAAFRDDLEKLIEDLRSALAAAFESDEYRARMQEVQAELQEQHEQALEALRLKAQEQEMAMLRTPSGLVFAPMREGEVISPEEFKELPQERREHFEQIVPALQEELQQVLGQVPRLQREIRRRLEALNREVAAFAVGSLIDELCKKYETLPQVVEHLEAVREDVLGNVRRILPDSSEETLGEKPDETPPGRPERGPEDPFLHRYQVNLLVDHRDSQGAPVVYEDNPTYANLIGRIEHTARMGALVTDFRLIKPGALHLANGGYLILEARKLLAQPFAWEGLKRAMRSKQVRIETVGQAQGMISTISLEPEPIPLRLKVALVGEPALFYTLSSLEPEFPDLFKVVVDFDERMPRDAGSQALYARLIGQLARTHDLRPLDRAAVARVIERSARLVGDGERLSTNRRAITDLLREADFWAGEAGRSVIEIQDVQRAIEAQINRSDKLRERMQEQILRQTILIDTQGEQVGQVNGLSVIQLGDFAFGRPNRITARVRIGKGEVVDIEREVALGGPLHSKGVLILAGFIGARYAQGRPLSLNASLVFEQSYSGVDGDSASSAELYALLSALAEVPIKQGFAVTGSVNQHGHVQAIGGVNEKIEGFFDVCQARGLTGEQGVLIPVANVKHLMLRQDVIAAVAEGKFAVYAIETIDQGIELLTGVPAGEPDGQGEFPAQSINGRVQARLAAFAERRAAFTRELGGLEA